MYITSSSQSCADLTQPGLGLYNQSAKCGPGPYYQSGKKEGYMPKSFGSGPWSNRATRGPLTPN